MPSLVGPSKAIATGKKSYVVKQGRKTLAEDRSCHIMFFGAQGSGKTRVVVDLLRLGLKVLAIRTDFGGAGFETVYNYFVDKPAEAHLLENLLEVSLDFDGVLAFTRDPATIVPNINDFDPDFVFWDGLTSYQENDVEHEISKPGDEILREDSTWKDWRSSRNATVFPLDDFLRLKGTSGKPWHKVVTTLEDKKGEYKMEKGFNGQMERVLVAGTEKIGPMLHTSARKIASAGFSIVIRTVVENIGGKEAFKYQTKGFDLMVKDRGYGLDASMPADFEKIWREKIEPKVTGVK